MAEAHGMTFVSPFDDFDVMAGQGTVGWEAGEQLADMGTRPDAVIIYGIGNGLASGVITALKARWPASKPISPSRPATARWPARCAATGPRH
ncbi:pyridoxal-phosphate dependent enzyme [Ralstonia solanacearum]|uniref:pyridoxal-phosphate dependent enzyme n=1 Tax=Ralstonia solanacearum TaxID=305 RepID=UPI003AF31B9E